MTSSGTQSNIVSSAVRPVCAARKSGSIGRLGERRNAPSGNVAVTALKAVRQGKADKRPQTEKSTKADRVLEPVDDAVSSPQAYFFLSAVLATAAAPALLFPHTVAELAFGDAALPHDVLHEPLFRIFAAGLTQGALMAATLQLASKEGALNKQPFQRLELGLVVFATIQVLLQVVNISQPGARVLTTQAFWAASAVWGLTVAINWGGFGKDSEGLSMKRAGPLPIVKRFQDDTAGLVETSTGLATGFSVLSAAFFAAGLSYMIFPQETLTGVFGNVKGEEIVYLWRSAGAALISLVAVSAYDIKEGAQKGRLGERPYQLLNAGLIAGAGVHLAVLLPFFLEGTAGPLAPIVAGTWAAAGGLATVSLSDPKKQ